MLDFLRTTTGKVVAALIGIVVLALFVWFVVWVSLNGYWPLVRDIVIIALAILTFVPLIALTYAVLRILRIFTDVRKELTPVAADLRETAKTLLDTARTAGDLAVKPSLNAASTIVGILEALTVVAGGGKTARQRAERRKRTEKARREQEQSEAATHEEEAVHADAP